MSSSDIAINLLGIDVSDLSAAQMCFRAIAVYIVALLMVRLVGNRRFAGKFAAIDIILSITLGATLSKAIVDPHAFVPILVASFTLVAMHWLIAALSYRLSLVERWVKGSPHILVEDGQPKLSAMKAASLTQQDIKMVLRSQMQTAELSQVALATLEPNGEISILPLAQASQSQQLSESA